MKKTTQLVFDMLKREIVYALHELVSMKSEICILLFLILFITAFSKFLHLVLLMMFFVAIVFHVYEFVKIEERKEGEGKDEDSGKAL